MKSAHVKSKYKTIDSIVTTPVRVCVIGVKIRSTVRHCSGVIYP